MVCLLIITGKPLFHDPYSLIIEDREGNLLGASIALDEQWRFPPAREIPEKYKKAVILFEDKRFYLHNGYDPIAIGRAFLSNLKAKKTVNGGSTITMQVVRLSRKGQPRTIQEKIIEICLAVGVEVFRSKDDILLLYSSHAPFGGNIVGLEAASWRYFGRDPMNLSWAESVLLAVLPNSPSLMHPGRNRDRLIEKRNKLLLRLHESGVFDEIELSLALGEPLPEKPKPLPNSAPHLLSYIKKITNNKTLDQKEGTRRRTTISRNIQELVDQLTIDYGRHLRSYGVQNVAAIVMDVLSGDVLAYIGNISSLETSNRYVDLIQAKRSTGSLFKPFLYAAMLDTGELLPDQLVPDIPTRIGSYIPENHTKQYLGAVKASVALESSLNVPFSLLLKDYGINRFYSVLKDVGITTLHRKAEDYGIPLILGGAESSLWELTGAYAGMGRSVLNDRNDNQFFPPRVILSPKDSSLQGFSSSQISSGAWYLTLQALYDVVRPEEDGTWEQFTTSERVAWKTGTSYGNRDAWSIGVTPEYVVGVWAGNATGSSNPYLRGSQAAAPLMFDIFSVLDSTRVFPISSHLKRVDICKTTGFIAGPFCDDIIRGLIPVSSVPDTICPYHSIIHLDEEGEYRVDNRMEKTENIQSVSWFTLPPVMEWYYKQKHSDYIPLPPYPVNEDAKLLLDDNYNFSILFPLNDSSMYIPVDIDSSEGSVVFEAFHQKNDAVLFWHMDGRYLDSTYSLHQLEIRPSEGPHTLTVIDSYGKELSRHFTVLSKKK